MASKSLWAIVDFLRVNQTVTPRQVQNLLGCDCKKAHNLLLHGAQSGNNPHWRTASPGLFAATRRGAEHQAAQIEREKNMVASVCRTSPAMQRVLAFYGRASA